LLKDFSRGAPADSINVGERDFHSFASREIDSCNACHTFLLAPLKFLQGSSTLPLSLFVLGVNTQHSHDSLAPDDFTFVANFLYRGLTFTRRLLFLALPKDDPSRASRRRQFDLDLVPGRILM
jgi:hypothetical protein